MKVITIGVIVMSLIANIDAPVKSREIVKKNSYMLK